jgi:hypothetical protein
VNLRRRQGLVLGAGGALGALALLGTGCSGGNRIEATAQWQGREFAFGDGIALLHATGRKVTIGFFTARPVASAIAEMQRLGSIFLAHNATRQPFIELSLHYKAAGKADYPNLERYAVVFANMGDGPYTFNRQHHDWLKDGGIELSEEFNPRARLLGRLRRAQTVRVDGGEQPYRWDLSFDARPAA